MKKLSLFLLIAALGYGQQPTPTAPVSDQQKVALLLAERAMLLRQIDSLRLQVELSNGTAPEVQGYDAQIKALLAVCPKATRSQNGDVVCPVEKKDSK